MKLIVALLAVLITFALAKSIQLTPLNEKCKLSNGDALNRIRAAGIGIVSSGNCFDRNNRRCTSLEQVRCRTIDGIVALRQSSRCAITITGGTETGHASGPRSHWEGYKLDFRLDSCINSYIQNSFRYIGRRGDGAEQWQASSGNVYAKEGNHWDATFNW